LWVVCAGIDYMWVVCEWCVGGLWVVCVQVCGWCVLVCGWFVDGLWVVCGCVSEDVSNADLPGVHCMF